jgi:predicted nucleotide-binding protein
VCQSLSVAKNPDTLDPRWLAAFHEFLRRARKTGTLPRRTWQYSFACVLLTPDDEGHRAGEVAQKKYRARQNVVLELGMVLARLGRRRVAILHKQSVELPSDIAGLIWIGFQEHIDEVKPQLFGELRTAGYNPAPKALH